MDLSFYEGKRILITGHTGFKGAWLAWMLADAGALVTGYALSASTDPALSSICGLDKRIHSVFGDVRNLDHLQRVFQLVRPQVVFHLAAQPIVKAGYDDPHYTYETNVMGTVNVLECVRSSRSVESFVNVTTDKVYLNEEHPDRAYREDDRLDGPDPYSSSKSCSELVTHAYRNSFFADGSCAISTARAGNVIGGGDFAPHRIMSDCISAVYEGKPIIIRNPSSTRPFQHVLEALTAYLVIAQGQMEDGSRSGCYNVGPDGHDVVSVGELATLFCEAWGQGASWKTKDATDVDGRHEVGYLALDATRLKETFGWSPRWNIVQAVERTVEWTRLWLDGGDVGACMSAQIKEFMEG